MTIDSSWLISFKEDVPHAFTPAIPFRARAVYVDGQIKLMQTSPSEPQTWDQFIHRQFARHLARHLERCDTVILAFDNYAEVPRAKSMTQLKRRRHLPPCPFAEHSELPCMVPEGERWAASIANRTFKARVIDLVLLRLPHLLLHCRPAKRLVVDYTQPVEYRFDPERGLQREELADLEPLGEADVKFPRHADRHGALLVDSIDGDSVPIALMHHELCLRRGVCPPRVCVHRMELRAPQAAAPPAGAGKRKRAPSYEFVHVQALYEGLVQAVAQSAGRLVPPTHRLHEMAMLVALIALTGTDFSRNLPQISGRALFERLPDLWGTLAAVFNPERDALHVDAAADRLVSLIYRSKYPRHARATSGLAAVLDELAASSISARTKAALPGVPRVLCTLRNANWLVAYWTCERPPDPIQPAYGFRTDAAGRPEYDD
jgi:hypothetical protein